MRGCTSPSACAISRPRNGSSCHLRCVPSSSQHGLSLTQHISTPRAQTTQALVKETLSGRKNTSPQNIYEAGQLYAAGALKAACIGLQCIGFDAKLYHTLLFQADVCLKTGRWRGPVSGLGTGAVWNVSANANADSGSGSGNGSGGGGAPPGIVQTLEAEREGRETPSINA